jgi:AraC-like DNA-binding protein
MHEARLYVWGARTLYLGPALNLSPHRNAVAVLCAGLGGDFRVRTPAPERSPDYVMCRTALIPANTLHGLRAGDQAMAFFYVDAQSDDYATLQAAMSHRHAGVGLELAGAARYLEALAQLRAGKPWRESREQIACTLGLHVPTRKDERIAEAIRHLHTTPADDSRLSDVARRAGLSPSRFLHLFKQTAGVPFRRYRLWARMGAAVRCLVNGSSLTEAALGAGFSSSSHFSAAFREMFGMPPSQLARIGISISESSNRRATAAPR